MDVDGDSSLKFETKNVPPRRRMTPDRETYRSKQYGLRGFELTPAWLCAKLRSLTQVKHFWVGYSGGLDSHVLLDLLAQVCLRNPGYTLQVIHVHHGLSGQADDWVTHCEAVCSALELPLMVLNVSVNTADGRSLEEVAREARFRALSEYLTDTNCLLLAHHADDQAETTLLRLFRGAGPAGLGSMSEKTALGNSELIRPLLSIPKERLLEYAMHWKLRWIEDESNQNIRFDRNFVRHEILPRLKIRWPQVVRSLNRTATLCLEASQVIQALAARDWLEVQGFSEKSLSVAGLLKLNRTRRGAVIRYWLQIQQYAPPSRDHVERINREILKARAGAKPRLKVGNYEISRRRDDLIVRAV